MSQTVWRVKRQPTAAVDTDVYDVTPLKDTVNNYADAATIKLDDDTGNKKADYPRGQRVEVEYSTDGGTSFTRRWAGFVQDVSDAQEGGADIVELAVVGYDHLLRRRPVYENYSSQSISTILNDLVTQYTAVDWVAGNVDIVNDKTISFDFQGEKVDKALQLLASESGNEDYGVNNDFEFYFTKQETDRSPVDILDTDRLDYDLPEKGKRAVNRVRVFYGQSGSESSVIVEDREAQKALKDQLGASRRVVISEEETYPEIGSESAAYAKAQDILTEKSQILTGTVTTFGRYGMDAGDVFRLQISEKNIDTEFRVAQIEYHWLKDKTVVTVAENTGDVEDMLVNLADDVQRVSARDADPDATFTRFLALESGATVDVSGTVEQQVAASDAFQAGFGRSTAGFQNADTLGFRIASRSTVAASTNAATTATLNMLRDLWQGGSVTDLTHLAVGSGSDGATVADANLSAEITRNPVTTSRVGNAGVAFSFAFAPGGSLADGPDITEAGVFDAASGGTLFHKMTHDAVDHTSETSTTITIRMTLDDDADRAGVFTATGQERLRDLFLGETGHEPTDMVYGTGTTAATESDTALGSKVTESAIDSFADKQTGVSDVVDRLGTSEQNGVDLAELGEENTNNELLTRIVFEALAKTSSFALESNHRAVFTNA